MLIFFELPGIVLEHMHRCKDDTGGNQQAIYMFAGGNMTPQDSAFASSLIVADRALPVYAVLRLRVLRGVSAEL